MNLNKEYIFNFISDDGHGWLEVPLSVVRFSGISPSRFSYFSKPKEMVYLEEDCDAPRLDAWLKTSKIKYKVKYMVHLGNSCIRNLSRC